MRTPPDAAWRAPMGHGPMHGNVDLGRVSHGGLLLDIQPSATVQQEIDLDAEFRDERREPRGGVLDAATQACDVLVQRVQVRARVRRAPDSDHGSERIK
jgi:hypothetical protein